jgi:hypothetical protein
MGKKKTNKQRLDKKQLLETAKQQGRDVTGLNKDFTMVDYFERFASKVKDLPVFDDLLIPMPLTKPIPTPVYEGELNSQPNSNITFKTARHYASPISGKHVESSVITDKQSEMLGNLAERMRNDMVRRMLNVYQVDTTTAIPEVDRAEMAVGSAYNEDYSNYARSILGLNLQPRMMRMRTQLLTPNILGAILEPITTKPVNPIAHDDIMLDEGVPEVQASATDIEL